MNVIKTEGEVDPLAVEASEEKKSLREEVTLLNLQSTEIKEECEIKSEEGPVPAAVPMVKYEAEVDVSCVGVANNICDKMAKSPAQRQREYKERLKEQGRYEKWKEKIRAAKREERARLRKTKTGRQRLKDKNKMYKQAQRTRDRLIKRVKQHNQ